MSPMDVVRLLESTGYKEEAKVVAELIADREAFAEGVRKTVHANIGIKKLAEEQNATIIELIERIGK